MKRTAMILALAIAGCNGGGESTTAAESVSDTGTSSPSEETASPDTGTPMTGDTGTHTTGASDSGDSGVEPGTGDTTAGEEESSDTTGGCPEVELVGEWLSEGEDVAPLLMGFEIVSIEARFEESTFEVNSTNTDGQTAQQLGTYVAEPCPGSETKLHILLEQTVPNAITVEGIFEIDGCMDPAVMRYEVIQTQPDVGVVAPTCDDDFGAGQFGADNVQIFVRQ